MAQIMQAGAGLPVLPSQLVAQSHEGVPRLRIGQGLTPFIEEEG